MTHHYCSIVDEFRVKAVLILPVADDDTATAESLSDHEKSCDKPQKTET
jgi:hypothetical protein